jgi:hypothetical protein
MATAAQIRFQVETALADRVPGALTPKVREEQEPILCGFSEVDRLQAFRRSSLVELCGPASSGRTSLLLGLLSQVTAGGETAALLDATDSFNPISAKQNGAILSNLLWIRPGTPKIQKGVEQGPLDQMLIAAEILLQSGGFSLIILDMADVAPQDAVRIPLTTWFALCRSVQDTRTLLVASARNPVAGSSACVTVSLDQAGIGLERTIRRPGGNSHVDGDCLIESIATNVEVARMRQSRTPHPRNQVAKFATTLQRFQ